MEKKIESIDVGRAAIKMAISENREEEQKIGTTEKCDEREAHEVALIYILEDDAGNVPIMV